MPSPTDRGRAAALDAVTLDAFGTLVELAEPAGRLTEALAAHGIEREREEVARAFAAEVAYYVPRAHEGRDADSLARLRRDCVAVFLGELGAGLDPAAFVPAFVGSFEFRLLPGAERALAALHAAGLTLACVSNWDIGLAEQVRRLPAAHLLAAIVSSAEAGVPKPDPAVFRLLLEKLGLDPARMLHVGDSDADRQGAEAAGLAFEPVPIATLPERLGLGASA